MKNLEGIENIFLFTCCQLHYPGRTPLAEKSHFPPTIFDALNLLDISWWNWCQKILYYGYAHDRTINLSPGIF